VEEAEAAPLVVFCGFTATSAAANVVFPVPLPVQVGGNKETENSLK